MKYLITSILYSLFHSPLWTRIQSLEKVDDNFRYRAYNEDGSIHQKGMYIESEDGKLLVHSYLERCRNKGLYIKEVNYGLNQKDILVILTNK